MTAHAPPVVAAETDPTLTGLTHRPHQSLVAVPGAANGFQFGAPRLTGDLYRPGRTISTNFLGDSTKSVTGVAATGVFTATAHGYKVGDLVVFVLTSGGSGLTAGLPYYVNTVPTTDSFTVATSSGGTTVTIATHQTSGTSSRKKDGFLFDLTNMVYTTSAGRTALRAADGGTAVYASVLTKEKGFRDWDVRFRYRPANDATTASTDNGPNLYANFTDQQNNWFGTSSHSAGNPNYALGSTVGGTPANLVAVVAPASPLSTSQDRIMRLQKVGDHLRFKDWASNVTEPGWQREGRVRYPINGPSPNTTTDNPEYGAFGIYGQFMGAYILEFSVTELVRRTENLLHNSDFRRLDYNTTSDAPRTVSGVASTGVFTTTSNHSFSVDDLVVFGGLNVQSGGIGITAGVDYYVQSVPSSTTFKVATTRGGAAVTFSTDLSGGHVTRNPVPAFWTRPTSALLTGNYLEVRHMAGPDGSIRPALCMVGATANDPNLSWYQDLWNPLNNSLTGSFQQRLQPHPQFTPGPVLEFSCWVKGAVTAIQGGGFGMTMDIYGFSTDAQTLMTRQTYHPGLSPTTAADASPDTSSYDGAETVSTFDWTYISSLIKWEQPDSLNRLRCQTLFHEATDTGYVYMMDPCLRPVG